MDLSSSPNIKIADTLSKQSVSSCGRLFHLFGVRVSVMFHLTCLHIIFGSVLVGLLSDHLLGNSCSLGSPDVLFLF